MKESLRMVKNMEKEQNMIIKQIQSMKGNLKMEKEMDLERNILKKIKIIFVMIIY